MIFDIDEIAKATGGKVLSRTQTKADAVGTDTRVDLKNTLFIALKGDQFDAHDFLEAASQKASILLVHREPSDEISKRCGVVLVNDTLKALQAFGHFWRKKMPAQVFGITGSNGKTTSKEFTAAILSARKKVIYSKGSLNNHWGVPLSLLKIRPEHQVAIIEMGMNHLGELRDLARLVEADAAVVTTVGRAHLGEFSGIEEIAKAKEEMFQFAPEHCKLIINLDNSYTRAMGERYKSYSRLRFSATDISADVFLKIDAIETESLVISGQIQGVKKSGVRVPVFGIQNVTNLMVAASFGLIAGFTPEQVWEALPECRTIWGRNQWVKTQSGARVLFDGYNANPDSMAAALENFERLKSQGRKIAVLGEMREMGAQAENVHRELADRTIKSGFDAVYFLGPSSLIFADQMKRQGFQKTLVVSDSYENSLAAKWGLVLQPKDLILMKGSRGMQLERVLRELQPLDFQEKT